VGESGDAVGFASVNTWFHEFTGVHRSLYTLTDWLGLVPVFVCALFAEIGLCQLLRRKALRKVDFDILPLGVYYLVVILSYLIFEKFPVNYRPILIEGLREASYPSSTTLLVLSVMPTVALQGNRRLKNPGMKRAAGIAAYLFSAFMVIGRLVSGVHWVTDIIGAVLLSGGLFGICKAVMLLYDQRGK
jgi:undecaprenyl-diphosphatase